MAAASSPAEPRFRPVDLMTRLTARLPRRSRRWVQNAVPRAIYKTVGFFDHQGRTEFMNFGYAAASPASLDFSLELYRHVTEAVDLEGKHVLEVGCGRGGGSAFLIGELPTASVTGVDLSKSCIDFCRRRHRAPGLAFRMGNAQELPFDAESFDAVVNIESSFYYPSVPAFLAEVVRVLRPGGWLLFADLRKADDVPLLRSQVAASGLNIVLEERITPNVLRALELDAPRRRRVLKAALPRFLWPAAFDFAGVPGSRTYEMFRTGGLEYLHFVLRKD